MITALYAAACAFFLVFLSSRIIGLRRRHRVSVGHGGNPDLERAMRVQANFTEYAPLVLIMLALAELQGLPGWAVHIAGVSFVVARVSHYLGFRSSEAPGQFRMLGMALTFGVLIVLAVVLIGQMVLSAL